MKNLDMKSHQNIMTDTQILVLFLAKSLSNLNSAQSYILYLDNLFINDSLAKTLKELDIKIMKTIQIKILEFFLTIKQLKYVKKFLK